MKPATNPISGIDARRGNRVRLPRKTRTAPPAIVESGTAANALKWSGLFIDDWEILVYDRQGYWEACFFDRDDGHEHVIGDSLEDARCRAEERIRVLHRVAAPLKKKTRDTQWKKCSKRSPPGSRSELNWLQP